jgi:hypothetical protein
MMRNFKLKTELCKKWIYRGECPYNDLCQYAHGPGDVMHPWMNWPYRVLECRVWTDVGWCPYGKDCCFAHPKPLYTIGLNTLDEDDMAYDMGLVPARRVETYGATLYEVLEPSKTAIVAQIRELIAPLSPHGAFPGPNPCSIERADLTARNASMAYWVCEKTDGVRAALVFLTHNALNLAVLVTRTWEVYMVRIRHVPKVVFQGTVFDGELVSSTCGPTWLGFDAVFVAGIPVYTCALSGRLSAASRAMSTYAHDPADSVIVAFKTFFKTLDAYATHTSPYPNDGHVFTPEKMPVVIGRHAGLFKLKTGGRHTVDFEFRAPDGLFVYDPKRRESVRVGTLTNVENVITDGCIVEATWKHGSDWDMVSVRTDKNRSNDYVTYTKTLTNIRENLQLCDMKLLMYRSGKN